MPKVSVIMNCYNGERFVKEAIDSVYAQTCEDWEIIFWDNASTDRTAEIAQNYDARLRYFRAEQNVPLGRARNLAMEKATGDWIAFVDYDDVSFPFRFERQLAAVAGGNYVMCSAGIRYVSEDGRKIRDALPLYRSGNIFDALLRTCDLYLQTTMVNGDVLRRLKMRINEECHTSEDYNLFMRLAAKGEVCLVPEVLSTCRIVHSSLTDRTLERHAVERFLTLEDLKAENPGIEWRFAAGFREAAARGRYYRAKHLMSAGDARAARSELKAASGVSAIYLLFYGLSFWPQLWQLVHDREIKSKLSRLLPARST